jgi:hypothetical protein
MKKVEVFLDTGAGTAWSTSSALPSSVGQPY